MTCRLCQQSRELCELHITPEFLNKTAYSKKKHQFIQLPGSPKVRKWQKGFKEKLPRDMAIYLVRRYSRQSPGEVGEYFGLRSYSTVSSAVEQIKVRSRQERSVLTHLEDLQARLDRSQRPT